MDADFRTRIHTDLRTRIDTDFPNDNPCFKKERGFVLISVYLVIALLLVLGTAYMSRSIMENWQVRRYEYNMRALYIAEGGLERLIYDCLNDSNWQDGAINGTSVSSQADQSGYYMINYSDAAKTALGGTFTASIKYDGSNAYLRSQGLYENVARTLYTYIESLRYLPFGQFGINSGGGSGADLISGNVNMHGPLVALGEEPFIDTNGNGRYDSGEPYTELISDGVRGRSVAQGALNLNMGGGAKITNNYAGMPAALRSRVPNPPTVLFGGEQVETLNATLRVKYGLVSLGGSSSAGTPNAIGNTYKETLGGVYLKEGYSDAGSPTHVYSDNGPNNPYDLPDAVRFPSLSDGYTDPSTGIFYSTLMEYFRQTGMEITNSGMLSQLANITPSSNFSYSDPFGNSISMNGQGVLTVNGKIYINGGDFKTAKSGNNKTIYYQGRGTIIATGDVEIKTDLYSNGIFPTADVLGLFTPDEMKFDEVQISVMGVFYAGDEMEVKKQTNLVGTMVAYNFELGENVPNIYYVPTLVDNLPPGLSGTATTSVSVKAWWE